jgi:hypothetical protein
MKKKFLFGMIALLSASLVFMSCPPEADPEPETPATPAATVADVTISGTVGTALTPQPITITIVNDTIKTEIAANAPLTNWFGGLPANVTAKAQTAVTAGATSVTIIFEGTPTAVSSAQLAIIIPAVRLTSNAALTVTPNADAKFAIVRDITLSKPTWSAGTPNASNIEEMLTRLWNDAAPSTVQGITQGQVFSYDASTNTLTVNKGNITDGLQTWITTQWGGTNIPLKVEVSGGTLTSSVDVNWSNAHLIWIDVTNVTGGSKTVQLTGDATISYTLTAVESE